MYRSQRKNLLSILAVSVFIGLSSTAEDKVTENAVNYLIAEQDAEGAWNREKRKQTVDTLESFRALQRVRGGETALNCAKLRENGLKSL